MVLFRQKFVVFGRKVVVFWQNGSIWANWFNLGKLVQFGQIGCVWVKGVAFGQKACLFWQDGLLGKFVLFGQ